MKSVEHTILEGGHRKLGKGKHVMKDACKVHLRIGVVSHETICALPLLYVLPSDCCLA